MSSFFCPKCDGDNVGVVDSRPRKAGIYRRRVCRECRHRFSTMERLWNADKMVKDEEREIATTLVLLNRLKNHLEEVERAVFRKNENRRK